MKFLLAFSFGFISYIVRDAIKHSLPDHWRAFFVYRLWPRCEHCGTIFGLKLEDSRTCYPTNCDPFDGKNPNRSQLLCRRCAEYHHEYWDDMWKEYYSGRL
jgi:hypothetical protein